MEFGRLGKDEVDNVDFKLPPDSAFTKATLAASKKLSKPMVYVGCAKWGRKEWVGQIYPKKTKDANFLDEYVKHFNGIELNATHYKVYDSASISKWAAKAARKDFVFCPKVPQTISHYSNLITPDVGPKTDKFLEGIMAFREHLGPIFFQVSDRYSPASRNNLFTYLKSLPQDLQFFLELRHPEWFADKAIRNEWLETIQKLNIGAVITDATGRRDCVHMELPVSKAFIRFVGNGLVPTDYSRVDSWIKRIKSWLDKGLNELYFFMHQHDERYSPKLCDYVIEQMNKHCGTELKRIAFLDNPQLFD
ncbi:MAG: DUF72 domain-containing protein [Chitinophagaceae bacterium]|nr:DUF72 domain-containing protein [Chitinophagaceae bacterium]